MNFFVGSKKDLLIPVMEIITIIIKVRRINVLFICILICCKEVLSIVFLGLKNIVVEITQIKYIRNIVFKRFFVS